MMASLRGRSWNFGCSYRPDKVCKYKEEKDTVMGGGCRYRKTEGAIDKGCYKKNPKAFKGRRQ